MAHCSRDLGPIFKRDEKDTFTLNQINGKGLLNHPSVETADRKVSEEIVNDVIGSTKGWLKDNSDISDDVMDMLKSLWLSKLDKKNQDKLLDASEDASEDADDESEPEIAVSSSLTARSKRRKIKKPKIAQLDGPNDSSDDDEDLDNDDDDDDDDDDDGDDPLLDDEDDIEDGADEEPLGSGDDISDEDPSDLFNTANVIVCQYDKITHVRNKWKFNLKDGIMNLNGRDYVFQRATGDAEW